MMKSLRASLAAAAIALIGIAGAGTASAKPLIPIGPNKLVLKLCYPHYETKVQFVGIRKIGHRFFRVYRVMTIWVDRLCRRHVVSVRYRLVPLFIRLPLGKPAA
jgi:hypothetical protein